MYVSACTFRSKYQPVACLPQSLRHFHVPQLSTSVYRPTSSLLLCPKPEILEQDVVYNLLLPEIDQAAMLYSSHGYVPCVWGHIMYLKSLALNRCSSTGPSSFASLEYFLFFLLFLLCLLEMLGSLKIFGFFEVLRLLVYDALHIYLDCRG